MTQFKNITLNIFLSYPNIVKNNFLIFIHKNRAVLIIFIFTTPSIIYNSINVNPMTLAIIDIID